MKERPFCILPWTHLHIRSDGVALNCCMADSESGTLGNANCDSLHEIWNSDRMKTTRIQMLEGTVPQQCKFCYQREQDTNGSFRRLYNKKYSDHMETARKTTNSDGSLDDVTLRYLDMRLSNFCNFKCRMCGHYASSAWYDDEQKLNGHEIKGKKVQRVYDNNPEIWDDIANNMFHVDEIYFAGGEPLLMPEHFWILDKLIELGKTDVKIWYNTNFSVINQRKRSAIEYWKQFKNVYIQASLDATHDLAAYLRHGTKWNQIEENRMLLQQHVPHVQFGVSITWHAFNAHALLDMYDYFTNNNWLNDPEQDFNLNPLYGPDHMHIDALPDAYKIKLAQKIEQRIDEFRGTTRIRFEDVAKMLRESNFDEDKHRQCKDVTQRLDQMRNEKLESVCPEVYEVLHETNI